jgi:uncharacterized iron-regulated membrane protein
MPAGKYTLLIEQGATLNLSLAYKDSANAAVNLTGYSGKMQIRSDYADNNPTTYLTLSSSLQADGTGITLGGVSGTIGIVISAASSSVLTFSSASYDLEITSGSVVTRLLQGPAFVSKEVTR